MISPGPVSGIGPDASYLTRLEAFCKSLQLLPGVGYRLKRGTNGTLLEFPAHGGGGPPSKIDIKQYTVIVHLDGDDKDYISCTPSGGGDPVKILTPPLLRFSQAHRSARGQSISYDAYSAELQSRRAVNTAGEVVQYITPSYAAGDIIYAVKIGEDITDLNIDGRVFAAP
jgi:hypothetical protein